MCQRDRRLAVLLRDYGYEFQGGVIIQKGIAGFTHDRLIGRAKSLMAAAERLTGILDAEYCQRYSAIVNC